MNKAQFEKLTLKGKIGEINRRKRWRSKNGPKRSRLRKLKITLARLEPYGQEAVELFKQSIGQPKVGHSKQRMAILRRSILEKRLGYKVSNNTYNRILNLNIISGKELLSVGWNCMSCNMPHSHPRFFDVDHIIQVSAGGLNIPENLQILCPNCHKKKTIQCDGFEVHQSFRPLQEMLTVRENTPSDRENTLPT